MTIRRRFACGLTAVAALLGWTGPGHVPRKIGWRFWAKASRPSR